ncbi:MAG: FKBP-type peptidyl-prolyl cis-trans isomerase, partial [Nanoarchaeota archaeon]
MAEKVQLHDFVEVDYTGKLTDGLVFDTTIEKVAKEHNLRASKHKYSPAAVCIGERQVLPGLDAQLDDKEIGKEYMVTLSPEIA